MLYDISLRLVQSYAQPTAGRHHLRLLPAEMPGRQRLVAGHVGVTPEPGERTERTDFFGNRVTGIGLGMAHDTLELYLQARVERMAPAPSGPAVALTDLPAALETCRDLGRSAPHHFRWPSRRVPRDADMTAYAHAAVDPASDVCAAVAAVGRALHRDMTFDGTATAVDTPARAAFDGRRGVCQDFAHIMVACLRGLGIPAAYVSGFLRTTPPPGRPRLAGADAMHAWVAAWAGADAGWIEYDPTNALVPGEGHIEVARGRDFDDAAPVRGVLRTSGRQRLRQSVDVVPVG